MAQYHSVYVHFSVILFTKHIKIESCKKLPQGFDSSCDFQIVPDDFLQIHTYTYVRCTGM